MPLREKILLINKNLTAELETFDKMRAQKLTNIMGSAGFALKEKARLAGEFAREEQQFFPVPPGTAERANLGIETGTDSGNGNELEM